MAQTSMIRVFGVRHHGPGSARSLLAALEQWQPAAVLIEGPPEGEDLLSLAVHPDMRPPVALLCYVPDEPRRAAFYPYAEFSPEWQAMHYGLQQGIPVRFMDLPQKNWLAIDTRSPAAPLAVDPVDKRSEPCLESEETDEPVVLEDPLDALAQAAGFVDGERWWEHLIEERPCGQVAGGSPADVFAAVMEMMQALRSGKVNGLLARRPVPQDPMGPVREAAMRQTIRLAQREGHQRIAVVCGAWHAPALDLAAVGLPPAKEDAALLKGLPKVQVRATWVAWGYEHLARASGYGAGAISPGWYEHLWQTFPGNFSAMLWLGRVAQLLREQDLDASAAQVIEAVRLAEALAALRGRPRPGLEELNQASLTIFCFGNPLPLQVIGRELIIGHRLGQVPDETPMVPLYQDLVVTEGRLRFQRQMSAKQYDLDLRQPIDLARSRLLHRLLILGVPWGILQGVGSGKGTFHEIWTVQWQPQYTVAVIERAVWGNTVHEAATEYARHLADTAPDLPSLTGLLDRVLLADLSEVAAHLIEQIQAQSALAGDIGLLMDALPALARTLRYGNVRLAAGIAGQAQTEQMGQATEGGATPFDASSNAVELQTPIRSFVNGLVARICIGLPLASASLDDDAAQAMLGRMEGVQTSLGMLNDVELTDTWQRTLGQLAGQMGLHGLLAGRCCRLLFEQTVFSADDVVQRLGLVLSAGSDPGRGAAWLEGLLRGSGLLLLHEEALWHILDGWVTGLTPEHFASTLPLLRRTFAAFPAPERRQMGERLKRGVLPGGVASEHLEDVDLGRADAVIPLLGLLLGIKTPQPADVPTTVHDEQS